MSRVVATVRIGAVASMLLIAAACSGVDESPDSISGGAVATEASTATAPPGSRDVGAGRRGALRCHVHRQHGRAPPGCDRHG